MPRPHPPESREHTAVLARLRRQFRVKDLEIDILKRASAFFARENVPEG